MLPTDQCIEIASCAYDLNVASQYVFWDDAHKTTAVHAIMADAIVTLLPEPATGLLIVPALIGMVAMRRRRSAASGRCARASAATFAIGA